MPVGLYGQSLNTAGIELEGTGLERNLVNSNVVSPVNHRFAEKGGVITLGKDASVEFKAEYVRMGNTALLTSTHTKETKRIMGFGNSDYQRIMGYELITLPLEMRTFAPVVYETMYRLNNLGDFSSKRASTHVHIGFPHNLKFMKNLLRVCLTLDPVLFRLGGMGGEFRGNFNLACYARPLLNSACVPISGKGISLSGMSEEEIDGLNFKWAQLINPRAALDADSVEQFWASFGILAGNPCSHKYHPSRYTATNFYAIPAHGTIEFRHGNFTRNPELAVAYTKFIRMLVEMSVFLGKQELYKFDIIDSNKQISMSDAVAIMSMVLEISREKDLEDLPDDGDMSLLIETMEKSSFTALPATPVKTHIKDFVLPMEIVRLGNLAMVKAPLSSKSLDIHTISLYSIYD